MATAVEEQAPEAMKVIIDKAINDLFEENGTFECQSYVNEAAYTEHHWDVISFSAQQEPSKGEFDTSHTFTSSCDEVYSSGDSDRALKKRTMILPNNYISIQNDNRPYAEHMK